MTPRIITFEGKSAVSGLIGAFTGSMQSHCAWQVRDGTLFEAVDKGFMATAMTDNDPLSPFRKYHPAGTVLHFFEYKVPLTLEEEVLAEEFLSAIELQPYGFRTLFTFMLHPQDDPEPGDVICSEAVLGASIACHHPLQERLRPWNCSPADIFHSPLLNWTGTHIL